jgi:hypothetical protein
LDVEEEGDEKASVENERQMTRNDAAVAREEVVIRVATMVVFLSSSSYAAELLLFLPRIGRILGDRQHCCLYLLVFSVVESCSMFLERYLRN